MEKRKTGLAHGTWVLVADGETALFLVNQGDEQDMHLVVRDKEAHENPNAQDWAASKPGRFNDGPSVQRSAVDDTDWHQLEKERFARDLADILYADAHAGKFDSLVIVASRVVLSQLRQELHQSVQDKLLFDLPKVLTNHPLDEIEELLSRELAA